MVLYFITGNGNKFEVAKKILDGLDEIEQMDLDFPEIQELDMRKIVEDTLNRVLEKGVDGEFFCEDTGIYLDCLNGFPGPLIKWLFEAIGNQGIYDLVSKHSSDGAVAKSIVGYSNGKDVWFFEGVLNGRIVAPRGEGGFGWDSIFQPDGFDKTFAEMSLEEKEGISMRRVALEGLREYLVEKN